MSGWLEGDVSRSESDLTSVEICAGAGGQAVGLHNAGFRHAALVEMDPHACETLSLNVRKNPDWAGCKVIRADLNRYGPERLGIPKGDLSLLSGGVPCPPFSAAGKRLGKEDERDLFPVMCKWIDELRPKAVMIENVKNLMERKFETYRKEIAGEISSYGYQVCKWEVLTASDFGVPQHRPRAIFVAIRNDFHESFQWPTGEPSGNVSVASALVSSMYKRFESSGDPRANDRYEWWLGKAELGGVAPTLVGGSKKHGGADLGPTRAKEAWLRLGVDATGVAEEPEKLKDPERDLFGGRGPKLTVSQAAILQGFPPDWQFSGRKTASYRQVGNAFPPPVAEAVGKRIIAALEAGKRL